ncbi:hypothetical protein FRC15_002260 [Serendipita sp. 397]|nr:hypothetical protein FRC15_002260 [Serendipita sp. 397]KAG8801404.1 hypothetical protein FRC16_000546 [Serendipita sp. 398]
MSSEYDIVSGTRIKGPAFSSSSNTSYTINLSILLSLSISPLYPLQTILHPHLPLAFLIMRFQLPFAVLFFAAAGLVSSAVIPEVPNSSSISSTEVLPAQHHLTGVEAGQQVVHLARRTSATDKTVSSNGHASLSRSHATEHTYHASQAASYGKAAAGYEEVAARAKSRMDNLDPSHASHGVATQDHAHATTEAQKARDLQHRATRESTFHYNKQLGHNRASMGKWDEAKVYEDRANAV